MPVKVIAILFALVLIFLASAKIDNTEHESAAEVKHDLNKNLNFLCKN